jgi:opacity protein-like surface antigen
MLKNQLIYISLILNKGTIMKKILATLAAVVFSTSTFAADLSQMSIGITGNYGLYGADGKEENTDSSGTLERTTKKDGAAFIESYASIFAEYSVNDQVSIGLSFTPEAIETPQNVNSGEGGSNTTDIKVKAEFEELTTLYVLAKSDIGVYGKFGVSTMNIDVSSENAGTYSDPGSNTGIELALGYEHEAADGVSVRAELAYHDFDDVSANNGQTDKNTITITNMRGATGRISLVKSF